jgi:predicted enzyme related to lactoylglutathione lyase
MKILEIAVVAYPVTDMKRARAFYEGVLGLTREPVFDDLQAFWVEYQIGTSTLALGCHEAMKPSSDGPSAVLEVDDFDAALTHLKQHEVKIKGEPFDTPVCRGVILLDPDGNALLIHKRKAT